MREAGFIIAAILITAGAALIWIPLALIVAGLLLGGLMWLSTP